MNLIYIFSILLLSILTAPRQIRNNYNDTQHGTYVVSANIIDNKRKVTNIFPGDSLCVYGKWIAEVIMKIELTEIHGVKLPPKNVFQCFYLINLQNKTFAETQDLKNLDHLQYKPLSEKKFGFDFEGDKGLFHNEPYSVAKVIFQGIKAKKISYKVNGGPYNQKQIAIYVSDIPDLDQPLVLNPLMEKEFKGRIMEMRVNWDDQRTFFVRHFYFPKIKKEYLEPLRLLQTKSE